MKSFLNRIRDFFYPSSKILETEYKKKLISLNAYEKYKDEEMEKCYNHFKRHFKSSIFLSSEKIREYAIKKAIENNIDQDKFYMEFGVYVGISINVFASSPLRRSVVFHAPSSSNLVSGFWEMCG